MTNLSVTLGLSFGDLPGAIIRAQRSRARAGRRSEAPIEQFDGFGSDLFGGSIGVTLNELSRQRSLMRPWGTADPV